MSCVHHQCAWGHSPLWGNGTVLHAASPSLSVRHLTLVPTPTQQKLDQYQKGSQKWKIKQKWNTSSTNIWRWHKKSLTPLGNVEIFYILQCILDLTAKKLLIMKYQALELYVLRISGQCRILTNTEVLLFCVTRPLVQGR